MEMKTKEEKKSKKWLILLLAAVLLIFAAVWAYFYYERALHDGLIERGFYPLTAVMESEGYTETDVCVYQKTVSGKTITVRFDFASGTCYKNDYQFSIG